MRALLLRAAAVVALARFLAAGGGPEPSVCFATSWEAAVGEARLRNVPIVVHHHGFFCPPCWGMHQALFRNERYIAFAEESTVEVIVLEDLARGIERGDPNAATCRGREGEPELLLRWPGLTVAQAEALAASPAAAYNKSGAKPHTAVVDPHTLRAMAAITGGRPAKRVIETVAAQRRVLEKERGASLSSKQLAEIRAHLAAVRAEIEAGDALRAMAAWQAASKRAGRTTAGVLGLLDAAKAEVVDAAGKQLDAIAAGDLRAAATRLEAFARTFPGTPVGDRARSLLETARR